ncbi:MAG: DUF1343 domain-containing protein [Planctomycetales bacterium]|nr:DUF1343 domain-containing protein [Planctomycetales bacterium]
MNSGLDRLQVEHLPQLVGQRLGVLMNQASVDARLQLASDVLLRLFPNQVQAILTPQHGLFGEQQANMIESSHGVCPTNALPVFSLYSETRRPTAGMLEQFDCLVVDLQDVGTRVYTFIWTVLECLVACGQTGKRVVVLDRPNPIGGNVFEGPLLDENFQSFVGGACIPLRHGLTIAEMARFLVAEKSLDVDLHVVPMSGWRRDMMFQETGLHFVWPSPNIPRWQTALVYPGLVLLEGTNLSEGRGTTRPFELAGAPFIQEYNWYNELQQFESHGLRFVPSRFTPTFDKWAGQSCGGVALHWADDANVRSVAATVAILATAARLWPDQFHWLPPPYEYEYEKMPIDILFGSPALRQFVDNCRRGQQVTLDSISDLLALNTEAWQERVRPYLLY